MKHDVMREYLEPLKEFLLNNGLPFDSEISDKFSLYLNMLQETPHNVTSIKDPLEIVVKHFIDSLFLLTFYSDFDKNSKIIDVGTGAGFPSIPLKIIFPKIQLYLVESVKKKADFLKILIDKLNFSGIIILKERAEILGHEKTLRSSFDLAVSRALAPLPILLELTVPFVKTNGLIIAYKGGKIEEEITEAKKAIDIFGLIVKNTYFYKLPIIGHNRSLLFLQKTRDLPDKYPRRPGIPQKRPIR